MKPEISKKILGKMLSREATELVIKEISVEFTRFLRFECLVTSDEGIYYNGEYITPENLYDYWIDNIYKTD